MPSSQMLLLEKGKMTSLNMKLPSVPPSPVRAMGGSPGHRKEVKIDISLTPQGGKVRTKLLSQEIYVPDRPAYSDGKTGSPGGLHMRPIQWHLKRHWRVPESLEKEIPVPRSLHPHLLWWTKETNVLTGQPLHPLSHAVQIFTDASKEGWGAHLGDFTPRGVWSVPESHVHINFLELKAVLLALKRFQHLVQGKVVLVATENTTVVAYINKAANTMRSGSLCALLWRLLCWCNLRQVVLKARHIPGRLNVIADKLSRHSDGMVTSPGGLPGSDLAPSPSGHVCNKIQLQASPVRVSSSGPQCMGSGRPISLLGKPGHVCFSPSIITGKGGQQAVGPSLQESDPNSSGLAQHAVVLGPGGTVVSDSSLPTHPSRPSDTAIQQGASQETDQSKPTCLAPRAEAIKEQGFSSPVASRIEAPQRSSTRTVYEAKWSVFVRWCESSQKDFRSPSVKQIADFLLHLFQEKNLQPSTIDGYRSAIADKLGNLSLNVSKDENLTRLLNSFHRDRPKGRRGVPSWNLSLVLHQLTKSPFEPLRKASLKHLTFKTVFLLALGSGKRRSEIHAWLNKNIRHQADWSKVSLYPSPSLLAKNHLAKEGPECVAPVVIPALAPTLDKSLKEDRSLCPVRALRYYLYKTQDLRQGKELVFVSFKKGFIKDISPATISSWIKQTVILCYEISDQEALTLHQVKAHDVRAFAASKAFQGGISLEQILAACHWKSHNTFTQFYLKDVAWADSELFHLGPVVAGQQIHQ